MCRRVAPWDRSCVSDTAILYPSVLGHPTQNEERSFKVAVKQ